MSVVGASNRELILARILRHPGISKSQLCRALGLGWGTVTYHIQALLRQGSLAGQAHRGRLLMFSARVGREERAWLAVLGDGIGRDIVDRLRRAPANISQLARDLRRSRDAVRDHLADLEGRGLVERLPGAGFRFHLRLERPGP